MTITATYIKNSLEVNPIAVEQAILYLHSLTSGANIPRALPDNGQGFSGADRDFGSRLARQLIQGKRLSLAQLDIARRMANKYVKQLMAEAQAKAA